MASRTPILEKPRPRAGEGGPRFPSASGPGGGGSGPFGDAAPTPASANAATVAVWLFVAVVVILFVAFTSTFLVRRSQAEWRVGPLPPVLWLNTAVLLASSAALEWARARGRRGQLEGMRAGLAVTLALGTAFLVGQVIAWRQLVAAGIYMATAAHSAFFYLLTGTHGVHLAGGVVALGYTLWKVGRTASAAEARAVVAPAAIYWHFVDVLWLYVFLILFWL